MFKAISLKRNGFTLIEIVIASLIVAVAIIPIINMISQANRSVASVEEETIAFSLATEASEWLKALPYRELRQVHSYQDAFIPGGSKDDGVITFKEEPVQSFTAGDTQIEYEPKSQYDIFNRYITIEAPEGSLDSLGVKVEVKWTSKLTKKKGNSVVLEFMKFKY
ncbi:MAG: prepilin-type N-terminal cleavage/methylation domain-containing protein [Candidatus Cloacimonetes bacterium]|nr:prepilin-type N-terminal cleavage/methylation domain-containing protein [Candidatus Cloacimonadota bacterium]